MTLLPPEEMAARLRAFYDTHNPGNQQNIAEIVRKYRGKEAALCAKLQKKYGVAPELLVSTTTPTPVATGSSLPTTPRETPVYDPQYALIRVHTTTTATRDPALDFYASTFDPLKALNARELMPPVAGLLPLDNIHKCRHLLPASDPHHQRLVVPSAKTPAKDKPAVPARTKFTTTTQTPLLFESLADTYLEGPFTLLRRCFLERKRVCVVVRRVNSVRGTLRGYLKAFDKHMNLVLLDVQQQSISPVQYAEHDRTKRLARATGESPSAAPLLSVADERRNRSFTTSGYSKQLFVRGDNIVMVLLDIKQPSTTTSRRDSTRR